MSIKVNTDVKKMGSENIPAKTENKELKPVKIKKCNKSFLGGLVSLILVVIIVMVVLYGVSYYTTLNVFDLPKAKTEWQAVFLSNGQVYFGHVTREGMGTVVLEDIYYLQVSNALQQSQDQTGPQQQKMSELSLVKLGNELHGPVDSMRINKDHVLFIEDLKMDGKVVEAIIQHKEGSEQE